MSRQTHHLSVVLISALMPLVLLGLSCPPETCEQLGTCPTRPSAESPLSGSLISPFSDALAIEKGQIVSLQVPTGSRAVIGLQAKSGMLHYLAVIEADGARSRVKFDARSTAIALVYLTPRLYDDGGAYGDQLLSLIESTPATQNLAARLAPVLGTSGLRVAVADADAVSLLLTAVGELKSRIQSRNKSISKETANDRIFIDNSDVGGVWLTSDANELQIHNGRRRWVLFRVPESSTFLRFVPSAKVDWLGLVQTGNARAETSIPFSVPQGFDGYLKFGAGGWGEAVPGAYRDLDVVGAFVATLVMDVVVKVAKPTLVGEPNSLIPIKVNSTIETELIEIINLAYQDPVFLNHVYQGRLADAAVHLIGELLDPWGLMGEKVMAIVIEIAAQWGITAAVGVSTGPGSVVAFLGELWGRVVAGAEIGANIGEFLAAPAIAGRLRIQAPVSPIITSVPNAMITAGQSYSRAAPSLAHGTTPITWSLVQKPTGMTISSSSGTISWTTPTVGQYTIIVRAANAAGFDDKSWSLTVSSTVSTPTISPNGGSYTGSVQVSLACSTSGTTIRYTTDGSNPTSASSVYLSAFTVYTSATVKARAFKSGYNESGIASASFTVSSTPTVAIPTISPNDGTYTDSVQVSLACSTPGATIRFTMDGSNPTNSSPMYTSPFALATSATIKVRAFKSGYSDSGTASASFTIQLGCHGVGLNLSSVTGCPSGIVAPNTSLGGNVTGSWWNSAVYPNSMLRAVMGFRDANTGAWTGPEPVDLGLLLNPSECSPGTPFGTATWGVNTPASTGTYRLWICVVEALDASAAIAEFKAHNRTIEVDREKLICPSVQVGNSCTPPGEPVNLTPSNAITDVSIPVSFDWMDSTGASLYDLYLGTTSPPTSRIGIDIPVSGVTISGIAQPNTWYYWRIIAKNGGCSSEGPIWSFRAAPACPSTPCCPSPQHGATGVGLNITLDWPDSTNTGTYDVYLGEVNPPSYYSNTPISQISLGVLPGKTFYWKVVARNDPMSCTPVAGSVWSFTTIAQPRPDFVVDAITVTPSQPRRNQQAQIIVRIKNVGNADFNGNVRADVYLDSTFTPSTCGTSATSMTVSGLFPANSTYESSPFTYAYSSTGLHSILAWVCPVANESNTSNNMTIKDITVVP